MRPPRRRAPGDAIRALRHASLRARSHDPASTPDARSGRSGIRNGSRSSTRTSRRPAWTRRSPRQPGASRDGSSGISTAPISARPVPRGTDPDGVAGDLGRAERGQHDPPARYRYLDLRGQPGPDRRRGRNRAQSARFGARHRRDRPGMPVWSAAPIRSDRRVPDRLSQRRGGFSCTRRGQHVVSPSARAGLLRRPRLRHATSSRIMCSLYSAAVSSRMRPGPSAARGQRGEHLRGSRWMRHAHVAISS